jgi:hypothetical protein
MPFILLVMKKLSFLCDYFKTNSVTRILRAVFVDTYLIV